MPRLHTVDGRAVQGTTSVSVNGVVPAALAAITAGAPRWLDQADSEVLYQNDTAGAFLQSIDLDTSALTTQSTIGANDLGAGGGVWIAFVAAGGNKGIRTNVGGYGPFALAGTGDVDEAGRSAFVQNYQAGLGMQAYTAAGTLVATWNVQLANGYVIRCRTGVVAYPAAGLIWHLRNLTTGAEIPMAQRTESINVVVPLVFGSRTLVLERSERLTLREAMGSVGYVLTEDDTFTPDICALSATVIRIAYSATSGEGPTALRLIDLNLTTGGTTNWTSASGSLVSSVGPTLTVTSLPATGGIGEGLSYQFLDRHPFVDPKGVLSERFGWPWVRDVTQTLKTPIDLASQVTGILGPANGGTGGTTGTTVLNGGDILAGTTPLTALVDQQAATLIGRGSSGTGSPQTLTLGTGLQINGTVLSAPLAGASGADGADGPMGPPGPAGQNGTAADVQSAGYWSPLTNGNVLAPELIYLNGDTISVFTPTP